MLFTRPFYLSQSCLWHNTRRFMIFWIFQTLGSIPWQSYFQRLLSMTSVKEAQKLSALAGVSALVLAIPPICLGVVGATVGMVLGFYILQG